MAKPLRQKLLTDVELELMTALWHKGEGTVHDVLEMLPVSRKLAYTSVSTVLRILVSKGVLAVRKEGRGHVYVPRLSKADYEATSLRHMVQRVFDGAPDALVRRLLETEELDEQRLAAIRALLRKRR
jgi:BlaI family transcriptional regulator, penicillinase repressor